MMGQWTRGKKNGFMAACGQRYLCIAVLLLVFLFPVRLVLAESFPYQESRWDSTDVPSDMSRVGQLGGWTNWGIVDGQRAFVNQSDELKLFQRLTSPFEPIDAIPATKGGILKGLIDGDLIYAIHPNSDENGKYVSTFDVSSTDSIVFIADHYLPELSGNLSKIQVAGSYLYCAAKQLWPFNEEFLIYDRSDSSSLLFVSNSAWGFYDFHVVGENVYFITGDSRADETLQIVDLSDRSNPVLISTVNLKHARKIFSDGDYAYVASANEQGLKVFDVSDRYNPGQIGSYGVGSKSYAELLVSETYAFLKNGTELDIINIASPNSPTLQSTLDIGCDFSLLQVYGDRLYLTADGRFLEFDVSNPSAPVATGEMKSPASVDGVANNGNSFFAVDEELFIYDVSESPEDPRLLHSVEMDTSGDIFADGDFLYVSDDQNRLTIYDVSTPANLLQRGQHSAGGQIREIVFHDEIAYVLLHSLASQAGIGGVELVDISDPDSPDLVSSLALPGNGVQLHRSGDDDRLYALYDSGPDQRGFVVIDDSDHGTPSLLSDVSVDYEPLGIWSEAEQLVVGSLVSGSGKAELYAYDVSSPTDPELRASVSSAENTASDMIVMDRVIYVSSNTAGSLTSFFYDSAGVDFVPGPQMEISGIYQLSGLEDNEGKYGKSSSYKRYYLYTKCKSEGSKVIKIRKPRKETHFLKMSIAPTEAAGDGSTVTPSPGNHEYEAGSEVLLSATPGNGWVWQGWSGSAGGTSNPLPIVMDEDKNVTANFQPLLSFSMSSPEEDQLTPPAPGEQLTIGTANITVYGVDWRLQAISFQATGTAKAEHSTAWLAYRGKQTQGNISTDADGYIDKISFALSEAISENQTISMRFYYSFDFPSKVEGKELPCPLEELMSYGISTGVSQINCQPIPESAQPGIMTPGDAFMSSMQTVGCVFNISHDPELPFMSIQEAIDNAATVDNDILRVEGGNYSENVILSKPLSVISKAGYDSTIVKALDNQKAVFTMQADNSKLRGFTIRGATLLHESVPAGVLISGSEELPVRNCEIRENFINENRSGIVISNGSGNLVRDNWISGNVYGGIDLRGAQCRENQIVQNKIGTDEAGGEALGNNNGISLMEGANANRIRENLISGNYADGIFLGDAGVLLNRIEDNKIGTDITGDIAIPNKSKGIAIHNARENVIENNLISGNVQYGIEIYQGGAQKNEILNNRIGTNADGDTKLPNHIGIQIHFGASENKIRENLISGNKETGLRLEFKQCDRNEISGNRIGTTADGTARIGGMGQMQELENHRDFDKLTGWFGVNIGEDCHSNIVSNNLISGNYFGVAVGGPKSSNNRILNNSIGTNLTGESEIPNMIGILIIGGAQQTEVRGNLISGNDGAAVALVEKGTDRNIVHDNYIGVMRNGQIALSNKWGVLINDGARGNRISRNIIGGNEEMAVGIFGTGSQLNQVWANAIGTNFTGGLALPNDIGVFLSDCSRNTISDNKIWHNKTGILESESYNYIYSNDIRYNSGSTGIHCKASASLINGNQIRDDATDGIHCEEGSAPRIVNNIISDNQGFGLLNSDSNVEIDASANWWGSAAGPGDAVSGSVDASDWLEESVSLLLSIAADTLFVARGERDSMTIFYKNWDYPEDRLAVEIGSAQADWLVSSTGFEVDLADSTGGRSFAVFSIPSGAAEDALSLVSIQATSQTDPASVLSDSFFVAVYERMLHSVYVSPDTAAVDPGDTLQFRAAGFDAHEQDVAISVVWQAGGGEIDSTGRYIAGSEEGRFEVMARDSATGIEGRAVVEIGEVATAIPGDDGNQRPAEFRLAPNYPNPFNPNTCIRFDLPEAAFVRIEIINLLGQSLAMLVDENQMAGSHSVNWEARDVPTGIYLLRMTARTGQSVEFTAMRKMLLLK